MNEKGRKYRRASNGGVPVFIQNVSRIGVEVIRGDLDKWYDLSYVPD